MPAKSINICLIIIIMFSQIDFVIHGNTEYFIITVVLCNCLSKQRKYTAVLVLTDIYRRNQK